MISYISGAGVLGYFVGKFSYRSTCEAKIMQLPNSQLAEALKRRKQGLSPFPEMYMDPQNQHFVKMSNFHHKPKIVFSCFRYTMDPTYDSNSNSSSSGRPLTSFPDSDSGGTWDIDEDKNIKYSGLDESQRPTIDSISRILPYCRLFVSFKWWWQLVHFLPQ